MTKSVAYRSYKKHPELQKLWFHKWWADPYLWVNNDDFERPVENMAIASIKRQARNAAVLRLVEGMVNV